MKHKNILNKSNELLTYFHKIGSRWFEFEQAKEAMPKSNDNAVKKLLSDMVKRGLLMRLKTALYYIIPYEEDAVDFMPDWHLLAEPLTTNCNHYIGYYSAMQIHNLITQPSLKEQIVVSKQVKPSLLKIKDVDFQFIYHNENHFFGYKKIWIDSYNKVLCSDLEKTFIDTLFKPEYAGGIVEIAKAIYLSKEKIDYKRLLEYAIGYNSQAVIKRLGYIPELLDIGSNITESLRAEISSPYTVLDTELPKEGKSLSRWRIIQNIDTIKSAIRT